MDSIDIEELIKNANAEIELDRKLKSLCTGVDVVVRQDTEIFSLSPWEVC